jgi:hypothetical protein
VTPFLTMKCIHFKSSNCDSLLGHAQHTGFLYSFMTLSTADTSCKQSCFKIASMLSFQKITTVCSVSLGKWPSFVMYHKTSHSYISVIKFNNINTLLFSIPLQYSSFETLFPYFKKFQNIFPASVSSLKNHIKNWKNMWENKIILICYDNHLQNWEMQTVFYFSPELKNKCLIFHSLPMSTRCSLVKLVNFLLFHDVAADKGAHLQFTHIFLNLCLNVIRQKRLTTNMRTYIHHIQS